MKLSLVFVIRLAQLILDIIIPLLLTVLNNVVVDMSQHVDNIHGPGSIQGIHYKDVYTGGIHYLLIAAAIMIGACILEMTCGLIAQSLASKVAVKMSTDLRFQLYNKLQYLSKADFDYFSTSSLIARLTTDVQIMQDSFIYIWRTGLRAVMLYIGGLIGTIVVVCTNNSKDAHIWTIPVVMAIVTISIIAIIWIFVKASLKWYKLSKYATDELNGNLRENILNSKSIRSLNLKQYEINKFDGLNTKTTKFTQRAYIISMLIIPFLNIVISTLVIVLVWVGTPSKAITVANVGTLLTLANFILLGLSLMINVILEISIAISSTTRIKEIFTYESMIKFDENGQEIQSGNCGLQNVNFKYFKNKEYILKDVSITVKDKEMVGIIGTTGSGKSTILSLLARMYDANDGTVTIDHSNIKNVKKNSLRQNVSICLQDPKLFTGTIMENLKMENKNISDTDVKNALNFWAGEKFIDSLPQGLDTQVTYNTKELSESQKQVLCLTRSILKDSPILLIDSATSNMDNEVESDFYKKLKDTHKFTTVVTSQRVSAVRNSDIIYVLDEGTVVDYGTHDELIQTCQVYKDMYTSQYEGEVR
ncbi:ABC transporter ATP-binding protein [Ureaplasma ceti]|uniref:ABC transporter ATP-binding protein n=1 Tax=Ureaplasma ceti TaxID=3119530 RepID=UPI0033414525